MSPPRYLINHLALFLLIAQLQTLSNFIKLFTTLRFLLRQKYYQNISELLAFYKEVNQVQLLLKKLPT